MAKTKLRLHCHARFYDQMGLLKPSHRDEASNYRYYDICQTSRLDIIRYMRNLGTV